MRIDCKRATVVFAIAIFMSGCGDNPCYNFKCKCMEDLELPCFDFQSDNYFAGSFGDRSICISDGSDAYKYSQQVYNLTRTYTGDVLNTTETGLFKGMRFIIRDSTLKEYTFRVRIDSPPRASGVFSVKKELDALEYMDELPLESEEDNVEGYKLWIKYMCLIKYRDKVNRLDPEIFEIILSHSQRKNKQPKDSYMRVVEYRKKDLGYAWRYNITFEMQMKLYYFDEKWKVFGTLQDAVFSTQSIVLK